MALFRRLTHARALSTVAHQPREVEVWFRHKEYAESDHPNAAKVVMMTNLESLGLSKRARLRLKDIVGPRLAPNGVLKLTCDRYPTLLQNRKFVKQQLVEIVKEARTIDSLSEKDIATYKGEDPFYAPKPSELAQRVAKYNLEEWDGEPGRE